MFDGEQIWICYNVSNDVEYKCDLNGLKLTHNLHSFGQAYRTLERGKCRGLAVLSKNDIWCIKYKVLPMVRTFFDTESLFFRGVGQGEAEHFVNDFHCRYKFLAPLPNGDWFRHNADFLELSEEEEDLLYADRELPEGTFEQRGLFEK